MSHIFVVVTFVLSLIGCQACWKPVTDNSAQRATKDAFDCDQATSKIQAKKFLAALKHRRHSSACAEHWWLANLAELKVKAKEQRTAIADVGCNKAYFSATALNYLAPGYGNHLQLFFKSHANRAIYAKPCGGCNECLQKPPDRTVSGQRTVDVFCFEPSEIHFVSLTQARDALYGTPDSTTKPPLRHDTKINFHILQAAVSNASGIAHFPVNCTGNTCSLGDNNVTFQAINVTTVDEEMRSRSVSYLDVLKVDTEGFDPAVLAGAYESLRGHRIGLLSFEYHSLWKRSGASLRQCVRYLDDLGYSCFYDGPTLAKVTGGCWTDAYELRRWTNIVCVVRGTDMERELYSGSYLASSDLGVKGGGKKKEPAVGQRKLRRRRERAD